MMLGRCVADRTKKCGSLEIVSLDHKKGMLKNYHAREG
jgi:hypothetical protein